MSPKHQLTLSVTLITAAIVVAWAALFRSRSIIPPPPESRGATFSEISDAFSDQIGSLNAFFDAPPITPLEAQAEARAADRSKVEEGTASSPEAPSIQP